MSCTASGMGTLRDRATMLLCWQDQADVALTCAAVQPRLMPLRHGPPVGKNRFNRIEMLTHLLELVAAQQVDKLIV